MPSDLQKDTARPRFFIRPVQNMALSEAEGRPVFNDREMVEIRIPGDKHLTWEGDVTEKLIIGGRAIDARERWPEQYAAFKRGEQRAVTGTPLEMWPHQLMTAARVAELKAINIMSVEELEAVPDNVIPKMGMGGRELRDEARAYLKRAKDAAADNALARENAELRARLDALEARLNGPAEQPKDKALEDCTNDELKAFIKRETGEGVRGNPSRDTLLSRAAELAQKQAA